VLLARGFGSLGVWSSLVQCSLQAAAFFFDQSAY
jgi:hypothetical protein